MSEEEQAVMLDTSIKLVREQAFYMKRAIDENNLKWKYIQENLINSYFLRSAIKAA